MDIRINRYIPVTSVEGPGKRFCIWVQGCSMHCKGCANKHMWNKSGGKIFDVEDIVSLIRQYSDEIEGVTFLGGEPLEQISAVCYIAKKIKEMNLTVVFFTGNKYTDIIDNKDVQELCKYVDILIDGKYEQEKADYSRPWVGSKNQKFYFLSNAYDESVLSNYKNNVEIRIENGKIIMSGMGDFSGLAAIK